MRRRFALVLPLTLVVACGEEGGRSEHPPAPAASATVSPTPVPTATAPPPTVKAPPRKDYRALANRLVRPLGPLIIAVRERHPTTGERLVLFDEEARVVMAALVMDTNREANVLHSAIVNIRDGVLREDVQTLERERLRLLEVR
jgi:hypothetical protein